MEKRKILNKIKSFISHNIVFLSYIFLSVLTELFLRIATMGSPLRFRAILADTAFVLFIGSFAYLFKPQKRFRYYFGWLLFFSCLCIANTIYYQFYSSFMSVDLLQTASMIGGVNDSLFAKMHFYQFLYFLIPIAYIIEHHFLKKKNYYKTLEDVESKIKFSKIILPIIGIIIVLALVSSHDVSKFSKRWNREFVVQKYGLYVYTVNDLIQSIQPKLDTSYGYDDAALKFRNYYSCKWEESKVSNEYTNVFKGKNVLFIHMESIQNFLVDLKIEGEYVTPNLNKIAKEGIYFSNFYPQISIGTSSDTEFTLLTGLMPSSSGTVFVNYYDKTYVGMPEYFNNLGYYTFSTHANDADYWNRKTMHEHLGYRDFFAKESYEVPEDEEDEKIVGLGLSDKEFFKQFTEKFKSIRTNHNKFYGTIITLSNHSPFNDLEGYGEFDTGYLEGSTMSNYLKSSHYADEALGQLITSLKENDLLEDTIIIFYGDHEARLSESQFDLLYNYDEKTGEQIDSDDERYVDINNYSYDLLKNTPFIIWNPSEEYNKIVDKTMGMYDVLPTIANMFGFTEKYSLGQDIFNDDEGFVVFPNGNVLTDKIYYNNLNEEYISFNEEPISEDYITNIKEKSNTILEVSNGILTHDLIKNESDKVGECNKKD